MNPNRYEVSTACPRRMNGLIQKRGSKLGMSTPGGFAFGSIFVAVGVWILLIGAKVVHVEPSSVHAPYWVIGVAGAAFSMGGFLVWGMAVKQLLANRRRSEGATRFRNEPALADYPWHPAGFEVSEWPILGKTVASAIGLSIFLSMFNWWAFGAGGPWMVKIVVIIFDLILLAVWWSAARHLARALKFGHSRIEFASFPYRIGSNVAIRWQPYHGVNRVEKGAFTLRCVQEWMESSGSGKNRTVTVVHEEIWSAQWLVEQPQNLQLQERVELRYDILADALPTQFGADKPIFWELEANLNLPGLDFKETYLVPVYGPPAA